jgi:DNA gyrase subunit A
MRINEIPASSGYGEPISKFFKLDDRVKVIAAETADERFIPARTKAPTKEDPDGPYLLVVTSEGLTLRAPYAPFRTASTKAGRRFVRLSDGAKVVMAQVLSEEESLFLASRDGHVIHFPIDQINILSGAGKGVMGIKLDKDDVCLGGALVSSRHDALTVVTSGGITKEFRRGAYPCVHRGGRGHEVVKRADLARVVPPPIELVDWEAVEAGTYSKPKAAPKPERNGDGDGTLFE